MISALKTEKLHLVYTYKEEEPDTWYYIGVFDIFERAVDVGKTTKKVNLNDRVFVLELPGLNQKCSGIDWVTGPDVQYSEEIEILLYN